MMIQPTEEEVKLLKELKETTDEEHKNEIRKRLTEIAIAKSEELKDCPFCHF
ncbi:MAG: hypothetical protein K2O29_09075 [Ruminococcus sp.]|nr:hypothetical protein [Ruminococcus sp.]